MTKVGDKEQARMNQLPPSRWSVIKRWILHHKIETTAILVCFLGAAVILALVYTGDGKSSNGVPPPPAPSTNTEGDGTSDGDASNTTSGEDITTSSPNDNNGDTNSAPSPAPDIVLDSPIFQKLALWTDLQDVNSPQYQAADWLIALDFLKLGANAENLQQRFALATLYLSTGGGITSKQGWTRCSAVPPAMESSATEAASDMQCVVRDGKILCAERENFELCEFTNDENGKDVQQGKRFLSAVHECEWFGITCDDNNVVMKIDVGTVL